MVKFEAEILEIRDFSDNVKVFYLSSNNEFTPKPGQYAWLSLPGITAAPMAIASAAKEESIIFAVRKWGELTTALFKKSPGAKVIVDGPYGSEFPISVIEADKPLYLIAGGTGITPIRSLVKSVVNTANLELFYGVKSDEELIFLTEIGKWPLTSQLILEEPSDQWEGANGMVTDLLEQSDLKPNGLAFICGPPNMMAAVIDLLRVKGLEDGQIYLSLEKFDKFGNV
ncbi:MAG: hypothetical protein IH840_09450, partial [Candidatus Heimdallarchaeota archaeon]|nr:hypothetical protein [Candidatus Heimdallarchaeota archaeon]